MAIFGCYQRSHPIFTTADRLKWRLLWWIQFQILEPQQHVHWVLLVERLGEQFPDLILVY
ncbi:BEM_HP_G0080310.mRNA.1.CDS.1 [Saccharomyces cerevisiae]|nr:BEM_HP_G0080310.mRNA.1.CDS.1 [Saccharomyces cerevisiae]CAI6992071.1 BEM_HP_G0080310.mRNA.1.CDS.1 [Saccharomyces cerevisiae]